MQKSRYTIQLQPLFVFMFRRTEWMLFLRGIAQNQEAMAWRVEVVVERCSLLLLLSVVLALLQRPLG
jgi:hypothetical protein